MGGSRRGNFGNTNGSRSFLDRLSDILTAASLIPGLDTITDLAAIWSPHCWMYWVFFLSLGKLLIQQK